MVDKRDILIENFNMQLLLSISKTLNILYVDDNEETRIGSIKLFENYFSNIDIAVNGLDGLKKIKQNSYHIIFTDLNMPVMDGIEMIKKIREFDLHIPIVVLSAHDEKEYLLETIKLGIDDYLVKPYNLKRITEVITKVILKLEIKVQDSNTIKLDFDYIWDKKNHQLSKYNEIIKLTANETKLLKLFINKENQAISNEDIKQFLYEDNMSDNSKIRNLISRLKKKLGVNLIESNYNSGYILRK